MPENNFIVISNISDNPFAIDIAYNLRQKEDISDIISLKTFMNTEFCPRFISDEDSLENIGYGLKNKIVIIVSTSSTELSRNSLAMRNCIIARAAKDNGAKKIILVEPELFYSCQDRGPQEQHYFHKEDKKIRAIQDRKKFDGQPFTSMLYAQMLKIAGIDQVFTVENHSDITKNIFAKHICFFDIVPNKPFVHYLQNCKFLDSENFVLCSPDLGASNRVKNLRNAFGNKEIPYIQMTKNRQGERKLSLSFHEDSTIPAKKLENKTIIVFDDMVRTGTTIVKCCEYLRNFKPKKIIFCVTHFHSSMEIRENLSSPLIDEIITTNTIPAILNRDSQGRLRKKMIVLKIEKLVSKTIAQAIQLKEYSTSSLYTVDISSKNPHSTFNNNSLNNY